MKKPWIVVLLAVAAAGAGWMMWRNAALKRELAENPQERQFGSTTFLSVNSDSGRDTVQGAPPEIATENLGIVINAMAKAMDEAVAAKSKGPADGLFVLPFTNPLGEITEDSFAIWYPTLIRTSYPPEPLIAVPYFPLILDSVNMRGLLEPGAILTPDLELSLLTALGCKNWARCTIEEKEGGGAFVKLIVHWHGKDHGTPIDVSDEELPALPCRLTREILDVAYHKKLPQEADSYLKLAVAQNTASLRRAAKFRRKALIDPWHIDRKELDDILINDAYLDWMETLRIVAAPGEKDKDRIAVELIAKYPDNPYFMVYYADMSLDQGEHAKAAAILKSALKRDPWNPRALAIIGFSTVEVREDPAAKPIFDRLMETWPDSAYSHDSYGRFEIGMAWHFRGSGWARNVTEEGWKGFEEHLKMAREQELKALEIDPWHYRAFAALITITSAAGGPGSPWEAFNKCISINPNYVPAYSSIQNFSQPKWGGSIEELEEFWENVLHYEFKNYAVYAICAVQVHGMVNDAGWLDDSGNHLPNIDWNHSRTYMKRTGLDKYGQRLYEKYFEAGGADPMMHALYGHFLYIMQRDREACDHFAQIPLDDLESRKYPWVEAINFQRTYLASAIEAGYYQRAVDIAENGLKKNHCENCNAYFNRRMAEAKEKLNKR